MNTMYRFEWSQIIVDSFLEQLSAIADVPVSNRDEIQSLLSRIFEAAGGAAIANSDWDEDHREQVGKQLLEESLQAVLTHRFGFPSPKPGVVTQQVDDETVAAFAERIDANRASRSQLEALPVLGPALADRIEEERRRNGYFYSMDDLAKRVKGIADEAEKRLSGVLDFGDQGAPLMPAITGSLESDFKTLMLQRADPSDSNRLVAALEEVALFVAANPHPYTRLQRKRDDLEPAVSASDLEPHSALASQVRVLVDGAYYSNLTNMLEAAQTSVSVCMFFIALPKPDHPTHILLDALAQKAEGGCTVQVLVDQDGKDDPYKSRLINADAVAFLTAHGVDVKADATDRLMHSKFVVIDDEVVVIGSHNWTAGSFFHYADVSMVISGSQACQFWRTRFDSLWSIAETFHDVRADGAPS